MPICPPNPKRTRLSCGSREPSGDRTWGAHLPQLQLSFFRNGALPRQGHVVPRHAARTAASPAASASLFAQEPNTVTGRPMWEWLLEFELMTYKDVGLSCERAATKIFEDYRWRASSVGPVCPHCGSLKVSVIESGDPAPYRCGNLKCRKHFSARVGTAFEYGKIPLWRWLEVIIIYGKGGRLTSVALAEKLDVKSQNTAWVYHDKLTEAFRSESVVPTGASSPTRS